MALIGYRDAEAISTTNLLSYVPINLRTGSSVTANRTVHNVFALEADYDLVRFGFVNDTASAYDLTSVVAASVGSVNSAGNYAPIDAAGNAVPWVTVTFDGAGADAEPLVGVGGSTTTVTVPAAAANGGDAQQNVPGIAWSDWMRIPSTDPADGSRFRYLATRVYNAASTTSRAVSGAGTTWATVARGRTVASVFGVGDQTGATSLSGVTVIALNAAPIIQTYSRKRGVTLLTVGDSLTQGLRTTGDNNAFGHVARALLSTEARPVTWCNMGHGGSESQNYYRRAVTLLPLLKPHVATYAVWTPNDTQSDASADLAWSRAMDFVGRCYAQGTQPVLFGPPRWYPSGGASEIVRRRVLARTRVVRDAGDIPVLDPDDLLGSVMDNHTPNPSYVFSSSDQHFNNSGHEVLGAALAAVIEKLLAARAA